MFFSSSLLAKVYKCSDNLGRTTYQGTPCVEGKKSMEVYVNTGATVDLSIEQEERVAKVRLEKVKEADIQKEIDKVAQRKLDAIEQGKLNLQVVKDNPIQYSAFAIPPYDVDKLSPLVKIHEKRLPEIEESRLMASQKALLSGECVRVENVDLSIKSSFYALVYSVDCSSGKTFYFSEGDLVTS